MAQKRNRSKNRARAWRQGQNQVQPRKQRKGREPVLAQLRPSEPKNRILRLLDPGRKKLSALLFSRALLLVLLIVLQVLFYAAVYLWLQEKLHWFAGAQIAFTLAMVLYLYNNRMDSTAKLTWMIVLTLSPIVGSILLAYTQTNIGHRTEKAKIARLIDDTREALPQDAAVLKTLSEDGSGTDDLVRYVQRGGCMPVYAHTQVRFFPLGEDKFAAMLEELEKAEKYIFMEYFIVEEGYMWGRILDILARKAKAGVDVRVMYDGMCELSLLPHRYPKQLAELGIKAKTFSPLTAFVSTHYNYRDHRKILVIDGKVAFNGGVNLADAYINREHPYGHWKDTAVLLRGEAAKSFALLFEQMWNVSEEEPEFPYLDLPSAPVTDAQGYVMPYSDSPLDDDKVGESVYMDMLYRANEYVHIMTPYLILDGELEAALKYAAERGIDVKIILPGIPDKKPAYALAKSHYRALTDAGVKLYEYTPGFVHAKVFVSDDCKAVVGTINLDYRSLYHHFECATYLYQVPCIADIEADFQATLQKCRAVTPETIRGEKLYYKVLGSLMKLIAPML